MNEFRTQRQNIFFHLLEGHRLTGLEALQLFGCSRLPARILELKKSGVPIKDQFIIVDGKYGKKKGVKEYWIDRAYVLSVKQAYADGALII